MANRTGIEWTDITTAVGIYGCISTSPACHSCYAAAMAWRLQHMPHTAERYAGTAKRVHGRAVFTGVVRCDVDLLDKAMAELPKGLKRCEDGPRRQWRCFPANMTDLFHPDVPFEHIAKVFAHFEARPHIVFQCLTKRAERMAEFAEWAAEALGEREYTHASINADGSMGLGGWVKPWQWPENVWAGATVEDQQRADERIGWLLKVPAAVRFLSMEPLLSAVEIRDPATGLSALTRYGPITKPHQTEHRPELNRKWHGIDQVITGGESGHNARPSDPAWFRSLRDDCADAGVAFFMKQMWQEGSAKLPIPDDLMIREFPDA